MKLYPALLFAALGVFAPAVVSAATFEGIVRMKMSQPRGQAHEMTYRVKEGFVRTEIQADKTTVASIVDLTKQEMIILMPEQKMYMTQSFAGLAAQGGKASADVSFEKTNETEKILGYDCVKYVSKSKDQISDVWVTEELGRFVGMGSGGKPGGRGAAQPAGWEKALMNKDFFPLRVVSRNAKGVEQFRMETIAVQKEAQPAALFAPPAGFQKFDMGAMMRGMMPGGDR